MAYDDQEIYGYVDEGEDISGNVESGDDLAGEFDDYIKGDPGIGIESMVQIQSASESGGMNVWRATLSDGTVHDFVVRNGLQGAAGAKGDPGPVGPAGPKGDPGEGIATGGTPGQALIKASNTDYATRWMDILPEDTASGSVASFPDGADDLPMGVVVDIDPVQDLHGYDSPWPAGGGKNLAYIFNDGKVPSVSNGELVTADGTRSDFIKITPGQTYTFSFTGNFVRVYVFFYDANKTFIRYASYNAASYSFVPETTAEYIMLRLDTTTPDSFVFQLELGSTATAYAPYSNICPISGWDGAKVTRTGRNLLDVDKYCTTLPLTQSGITWSKVGEGVYHVSGTATANSYFNVSFKWVFTTAMPVVDFRGKSLYLSTTNSKITSKIDYFRENGSFANISNGSMLPDEAVRLRAYLFIQAGVTIDTDFNIQLELGSTAHAYEPYTAVVTHEIPFSTEVYGGKLNVETGELVVDRAIVDLGSLNWEYLSSSSSIPYGAFYTNIWGKANKENDLVCSMYPLSRNYFRQDKSVLGNSGSNAVYVIDSAYTTATAFKTAVTGQQLVYQFATPITLTLDPVETRSLLGNNNVWADTGDVSVTYKANIQGYIDKKISAAVAAMS